MSALQEVLLDVAALRELNVRVPTDEQLRSSEPEINALREGGMKIHEITDYLQIKLLLGPDS